MFLRLNGFWMSGMVFKNIYKQVLCLRLQQYFQGTLLDHKLLILFEVLLRLSLYKCYCGLDKLSNNLLSTTGSPEKSRFCQERKQILVTFGKSLGKVQMLANTRSSLPEVFCKKSVLRNFAEFTGLRLATLVKKSLWHRCFPVNFMKFLRTSFFTEQLRWLLLQYIDFESLFFTKFDS